MSTNLKYAMELIQSHVDSIQKELDVTKVALDERTHQLDQEITRNLKLNAELEKLRGDFARLYLDLNSQRRTNILNKSNRVGDALSNLATQEAKKREYMPSQLELEVSSNTVEKANADVSALKEHLEHPDVFNLTGLDEVYKTVLLKTKHLHKFLVSRLDIPRPKLTLCLTDEEVEIFLLAKREVISNLLPTNHSDSAEEIPLENQKDNTQNQLSDDYVTKSSVVKTFSPGKSEVFSNPGPMSSSDPVNEYLTDTSSNLYSEALYVTKNSLLCDIELPDSLQEIAILTIDIFGKLTDVSQVIGLSPKDKQRYNKPVAITLSALQAHLKKRIKAKSSLKLNFPPNEPMTQPKNRDPLEVLGSVQSYITQRGKLLTGWFIDFLPRNIIESIDPYTFSVRGSFFVRERHLDQLIKTITEWDENLGVNRKDSQSTAEPQQDSLSDREDSAQILNTEVKVLDEHFTFKFCNLKDEQLFSFNSEDQSIISFNLHHQYIKKTSTQLGGNFWESLKMFIALWAKTKMYKLPVKANENSQIAKAGFMKSLKECDEKTKQYTTEFTELPLSVLFDYRITQSGVIVLVNVSHPFNEAYVHTLTDIEKHIFIQIYAAWLFAERSSLSNSVENALKGTREMLGLYFYHLVDEINHGEDLFSAC
ncbi:hypothetical protein L3V23_18235 [Vibrio sp. A1-b2]|uniref:hypothetical protein n=1 Tax=Vibrio sp. A1-b2 TaxID=2912248 RepID=UPI001F17135D|nr:hypothetical protein [Vibrio sp. A1-b2]MCF7364023.1 hypothetical protein [Vibrio sp. A1-b2]